MSAFGSSLGPHPTLCSCPAAALTVSIGHGPPLNTCKRRGSERLVLNIKADLQHACNSVALLLMSCIKGKVGDGN